MSKQRTRPVVLLLLLVMSPTLSASAADDDESAALAPASSFNPSLNIGTLCDQSIRNYRLLTPQDDGQAATDMHCTCRMVDEAPWGAPKIEIDCSALELENGNILAKSLPFTAQLLDITWNRLTRIPKFTQNLEQLKIYRLHQNHIEKIEREDLISLTFLTDLDLSNNGIENIEESAFNDLTSLKRLNLGYNRLSTLPDKLFQAVSNLLHLTLSGNDLNKLLLEKNLFHDFEVNAKSLQILEMENCNLSWLNVKSADALVEIRLRDNIFFKQLPMLPPTIKLLDLSANPVRRLDNTFYNGQLNEMEILLLEDMPNLYILDVSSMATFHNLRKVSLQGSRNFTYLSELAFDSVESEHQAEEEDLLIFHHLNEIILTGTKVRKLNDQLLVWLPKLEVIALGGCPMVCDCDLKWLMGRQAGITTNGICEKPLSTKNLRIDDVRPEAMKNCSQFSRFMFKIINGLLILLMIILCGVAMYYLVMGCRPSKKFYIRQRLGVNSPYSRITVDHGQSYRPTTISQA